MRKSKPSTTATELQELVNLPEQVQAFGRIYLIQKFTFGPMTQALEFVGPMGYLLRKINEFPRDKKGNVQVDADAMMDFAVTAASISGPSIFGIVSVATREPIEWLESQDALDGLKVFAKVVEKNLDFFSRKNMDMITALIDGLHQRIPESGGDSLTT